MPTPSDLQPRIKSQGGPGEWTPRTDTPKRSVFGNYRARHVEGDTSTEDLGTPSAKGASSTAEVALARAFIHRFLAQAFEDPRPETWQWLTDAQTLASLRAAATVVCSAPAKPAEALITALKPDGFDSFLSAYLAAFGHAARGSCPLNEIEYGDIKADPLFQPHRLADLAAFYRAFGLELTPDAGERQDHLCLELEFMCVLAAKEAYAIEQLPVSEALNACTEAQRKFLREHLGRWTPAFARRLTSATPDPTLQALASFTRVFVEAECSRFGVKPGSEELLLRPVDETADRMCDSCGLNELPPGATLAT